MQRIFILLTFVFTFIFATEAETYQITALTTPSITIGGKQLKTGERFNGGSPIKWIDNKQKMEVKSVSSGKMYMLSKKMFESKGSVKSIADYFLKTKEGSSRGENGMPLFSESDVSYAYPEKRIALVMGNSNYDHFEYLKNAQADASDVGEMLKTLGFDVLEIYESDFSGMKTALNNFSAKSKNYDVALFYYAGHGVQDNKENFLLPVERELQFPDELKSCLNCNDVMTHMNSPTKLMFIDACRAQKKWSRSTSDEGLAYMEGPVGSVIMFSTQIGTEAKDGVDNAFHSPFAQSILKNIALPDISFNDALDGVVRDTYSLTKGEQYPWKSGTLLRPFSFNTPLKSATVKATTTQEQTGKNELQLAKEYYDKKDYAKAITIFRKLADMGNSVAQDYIGWMYQHGYGVEKNFTEAVKWYRLGAEQGLADAQYDLGDMYYNGYGVEKNYAEALKWYKKSADQGYRSAENSMGLMYLYGHGVPENDGEALKWFKKSAEQGYPTAEYNVGCMYESGYGVEKDYTEALKWFRKSADNGYASAQNKLGDFYYSGSGVEQSYSEAAEWYRKSAEKGNSEAQKNLGYMYQKGLGVEEIPSEAVKWYRKSAEQDNATAQNNLGYMYKNGLGVEKNYAESIKWYKKSAGHDNAVAQNNLGYMYQNGLGVEEDYAEAVKWYKKSAEHAYASAQNNLGYMYQKGLGVEKNYAEAVRLYELSAKQGNSSAQAGLGYLYVYGLGVPQSFDNAYKWYKKAADSGDKSAIQWVEKYETSKSKGSGLTVTGEVKDETGDVLIGATIKITDKQKDNSNFSSFIRNFNPDDYESTDFEGRFTIYNVPDGGSIDLYYIGYKTKTIKITSKNHTNVTVVMGNDDSLLDK